MKKNSVSMRLLCAPLSVLLTTVAFAQNGSSDRTFTFGDSLSDGGNYFVETGDSLTAPFEPVPGAPYSIGGNHFSNGHTWIEQLSTRLNQPTSGRPASRAPGVFSNYAVGRARARAHAPVFPFFDMTTQVSTFLADYGGQAPSDARYVVWFGSNDVRDALFELQVDPTGAASFAIIEDALMSIGGNISALYVAGARDFLVLNIPNLAITPGVLAAGAQDPLIPIAAEQLSLGFNSGLSDTLDFLAGVLPGIQFQRLDIFALLNAIVADPASFGFEDVVNPCLTFGVQSNAICNRPDQRLFWDAAHPTKAGHAVVADAAQELLLGP